MAILQDVSELLANIKAPGAFATRRTSATDGLRLRVKGVGRIVWPITRATARRLCAAARPARYGFKDQTRLDDRIRDTWEIPKNRVTIDQRMWSNTLRPLLDRIRRDLGLPDGCRLRAELHNMLVYEPGQFFVTHQDSEKTDDMIGTLVVILPSDFTGGAIVLEHHDEKLTFRGSGGKLSFIAFYADCHHHVRPIKAGYRVVLTYNLMLDRDMQAVRPRIATNQIDALARCIEEFFETPRPRRWSNDREEAPDRLVYLLDHQYTRRGLGWNRLKNADVARVAALRDVARRLDCEICLALADVHESWSCEDEGFAYGHSGHRGTGWRRDYDEEGEEEGNVSETPALIDLIDSEIELRHWIGGDGRVEASAGGLDSDEVCYTKASMELEPFASEHEGYMGNWGNTVDRWYHRAAVVLWPRERTFIIRAKASPRWAVGEMTKTLKAGNLEEARGMAQRLVPFWTQVAHREEGRGFLERTLRVADGVDNPELAASLLQPFTLERLTPNAAPRLIALIERYDVDWCQAMLTRWASAVGRDGGGRRAAWLASLPTLCRSLCGGGSTQGLELARWFVNEEWTWVVGQSTRLREEAHPRLGLDTANRMSNAILGLLESSLISNSPDLHAEMLRFLTSAETDYPIRGLVRLLRTAHETRARDALRGLGLAALHGHCVQTLTTRLQMSVRQKDNWLIAAPRRCTCKLCGTLARFLVAPDQVRFEWPLPKEQRAHIHGILDAHDLPVSHATRRTGRPYTLVLMKTHALFEREATERRIWQNELIWLTKTAHAFATGEASQNAPAGRGR